MLKILINPGHCSCEPGAVSGKLIERELNLKVALLDEKKLKDYDGVEVFLTRRTNTECMHIADVIAYAKKIGADVILSKHHNSGGGKGAETYYQPNVAASKRLAELIQAEYKAVGRPSRGAKNGKNYRLLNGSNIPTVMTEYAFIDNAADRLAVSSDAALEREANADVAAIAKMYGLKKKASEMYRVGKDWKNGRCVGQIGAFVERDNAVNFAKSHPGTKAFDSKGGVIYPISPSAPEPVKQGRKLALKDTPLYASSTSAKPTGRITGTYYLYDGVKFGNRYRITVSEAMCGKKPVAQNVTGYISAADVR